MRCFDPPTAAAPGALIAAGVLLVGASGLGALDLSRAVRSRLENGLTVLVLEDRTQPLVSTQVLYQAGARNECPGATGLAHFVEHMAFRATEHFPGTDVVSRIYAVGGEWHGYTWIDQTTYFETVPVAELDLALQIQADRMGRALLRAEEVEAERGAVLTELHGYENDPASRLYDAVAAVAFLQHPYRNNTIGWTSDVEAIGAAEIADFYRRFYTPANAVLAIVGAVDPAAALARARAHFGALPARPAPSAPRTVEPPQDGERRIRLHGKVTRPYFNIAYRAPAAADPDFAPFLLLQAVLGGSDGVNFHQNESGKAVLAGTVLDGVGPGLRTLFIPSADPYLLMIQGRSDPEHAPARIEREIEQRLTALRDRELGPERLESGRSQLLAELVFDLETTEDAAHQLAYFEGIGALPVLWQLPERVRAVDSAALRRVAGKYLQPRQRTIGWLAPEDMELESAEPTSGPAAPAAVEERDETPAQPIVSKPPRSAAPAGAAGRATVRRLGNGTPVILQRIARAPTAFLRLMVPSNQIRAGADQESDAPVWRHTSINAHFLAPQWQSAIGRARLVLDQIEPHSAPAPSPAEPGELLWHTLAHQLGAVPSPPASVPALIVLVGDIDPASCFEQIERSFGALPAAAPLAAHRLRVETPETIVDRRATAAVQSQLGFATVAPAPAEPRAWAYRLLLYILTHGYEGRLGQELISRSGLIYFINSAYHSDGPSAWISIRMGVDPDKLEPTHRRFTELLAALRSEPPTAAELVEAQHHLIGRRRTAYQSPAELSALHAREWLEQGRLLSAEEFERRVLAVDLAQLRAIVPEFLAGAFAVVEAGD